MLELVVAFIVISAVIGAGLLLGLACVTAATWPPGDLFGDL